LKKTRNTTSQHAMSQLAHQLKHWKKIKWNNEMTSELTFETKMHTAGEQTVGWHQCRKETKQMKSEHDQSWEVSRVVAKFCPVSERSVKETPLTSCIALDSCPGVSGKFQSVCRHHLLGLLTCEASLSVQKNNAWQMLSHVCPLTTKIIFWLMKQMLKIVWQNVKAQKLFEVKW